MASAVHDGQCTRIYVLTYVHALKTHDTTVIDNQEEQQEHRMRQRKERGLRQQRSETS